MLVGRDGKDANVSERIEWAINEMPKSDDAHLGIMSLENVKKARAFHESFPQYSVTPLACLDQQAKRLGIAGLAVKDEIVSLRPQRLQGPRRFLRDGQLHRR